MSGTDTRATCSREPSPRAYREAALVASRILAQLAERKSREQQHQDAQAA